MRAAYPPLPCRASPPQGGRSICGYVPVISVLENKAAFALLADLPPCGGDARQGRGEYLAAQPSFFIVLDRRGGIFQRSAAIVRRAAEGR
ncbi:hypothetical protein DXT96_01055 [Agrobacterium sp. ICMP 6402]|nr:hypothetical protein [Agrobacterium sp. ICMP 6402]